MQGERTPATSPWGLPRRIHVIGAGGAGMSALAKLLHQSGHVVSGSDLVHGRELDNLADLGIEVWQGARPEAIGDVDLVVASSAVPPHDPERRAAVAAGIEVWDRPRLLSTITAHMRTLGATGTHGKTTTTGMLVAATRALGRDPSFVVGGELVDLGTNAHLGDEPLLLEADEAFGTFRSLSLEGLIVTNIEADHLDHYGSLASLEEAFADVAARVEGPVVACADDAGARALAERTGAATYGVAPDARWRVVDPRSEGWESRFRFVGPDVEVHVTVARPGIHNIADAAAALALLGELGEDVASAAQGLARFHGVRRRFERKGTVGGVTVVDDYAHHPSELAATIEAARSVARGGRIVAVFQPHLYSRTRDHADAFGAALARADLAVVTDVYGSREEPIPGVHGLLVADAAEAHGADVRYVPHRADVADRVVELVEQGRIAAGDLVVVMGAGDITASASEIVRLLGASVTDGLLAGDAGTGGGAS